MWEKREAERLGAWGMCRVGVRWKTNSIRMVNLGAGRCRLQWDLGMTENGPSKELEFICEELRQAYSRNRNVNVEFTGSMDSARGP